MLAPHPTLERQREWDLHGLTVDNVCLSDVLARRRDSARGRLEFCIACLVPEDRELPCRKRAELETTVGRYSMGLSDHGRSGLALRVINHDLGADELLFRGPVDLPDDATAWI